MTLDDNMGKFAFTTNDWRRANIKAHQTFNPASAIGGLRFEYTIKSITDTSSFDNSNGGSTLFLANTSPWTSSGWDMAGEKLGLNISWHKNSKGIEVNFNIANKLPGDPATDAGVTVYTTTVPDVNMDSEDQIKLAMELRDNPYKNDIRIGWQVYDKSTHSWSDWEYSRWFDPTDNNNSLGLNSNPNNQSAFSSNWKSNWQNNTYLYVEPWSPDGRTTNVWIDDAVVSTILQPAASNCNEIWHYGYGMKTDFNRDCHINLLDFNFLASYWLKCNNPIDPNCEINFQ
jgi:hypothetical protein